MELLSTTRLLGYDVIVDGIVGPWFLEPWLNIVQEHYEVHYIVLRASKEETMKRAIERSKLDRETNVELVETMWKQFSNISRCNFLLSTACRSKLFFPISIFAINKIGSICLSVNAHVIV